MVAMTRRQASARARHAPVAPPIRFSGRALGRQRAPATRASSAPCRPCRYAYQLSDIRSRFNPQVHAMLPRLQPAGHRFYFNPSARFNGAPLGPE
jgi:hypothetical protein